VVRVTVAVTVEEKELVATPQTAVVTTTITTTTTTTTTISRRKATVVRIGVVQLVKLHPDQQEEHHPIIGAFL